MFFLNSNYSKLEDFPDTVISWSNHCRRNNRRYSANEAASTGDGNAHDTDDDDFDKQSLLAASANSGSASLTEEAWLTGNGRVGKHKPDVEDENKRYDDDWSVEYFEN